MALVYLLANCSKEACDDLMDLRHPRLQAKSSQVYEGMKKNYRRVRGMDWVASSLHFSSYEKLRRGWKVAA